MQLERAIQRRQGRHRLDRIERRDTRALERSLNDGHGDRDNVDEVGGESESNAESLANEFSSACQGLRGLTRARS